MTNALHPSAEKALHAAHKRVELAQRELSFIAEAVGASDNLTTHPRLPGRLSALALELHFATAELDEAVGVASPS